MVFKILNNLRLVINMNYLLDTSVLIWWAENNKKLNPEFKEIIKDDNNIIFVSVASAWEIAIKANLKKLQITTTIEDIIKRYDFIILPIEIDHINELSKLPNIHRDPFDRILVAQSIVENYDLLTADEKVKEYFR